MFKPAISKIKAAFIAPCIGIGGADVREIAPGKHEHHPAVLDDDHAVRRLGFQALGERFERLADKTAEVAAALGYPNGGPLRIVALVPATASP